MAGIINYDKMKIWVLQEHQPNGDILRFFKTKGEAYEWFDENLKSFNKMPDGNYHAIGSAMRTFSLNEMDL